jgi:fumarylacetoacetate (FAA) hydrolase
MKLVTYKDNAIGLENIGLILNGQIHELSGLIAKYKHTGLIITMNDLLNDKNGMSLAREMDDFLKNNPNHYLIKENEIEILATIPHPTSCRDGYAFRQHVAAARRNRKVDMIPEFDEYPIFYFTNHHAIQAPGVIECMPDHFKQLDFELEVAIVIGKKGRNIRAKDADEYIAGYMIMNDMSARILQMEEMKLNLGPAKGKDFCTVIGPYLVTPDELEPLKVPAKEGHVGNAYNLKMSCKVNGIKVSEGNMADMDWTFAEIIERVAYGVDILPGDVIGSGTVGTGCFLELNGTGLLNDPNYKPQWLQDGDVVEMEVDCLGKLINTIKKADSDFSILALKKNIK